MCALQGAFHRQMGHDRPRQAWTYVLGFSFQPAVHAPGQTAVYSMTNDGVAQIWVSKPVYRPWSLGLLYFQNFGLAIGWQLPSLRPAWLPYPKPPVF